jgi:hypothetical protein
MASTSFDGEVQQEVHVATVREGRSRERGIERELVALSPGGRHPPVV